MLGRMNTAQQAQRNVAVGSMHDMTALVENCYITRLCCSQHIVRHKRRRA
jgi:hypothetical protein